MTRNQILSGGAAVLVGLAGVTIAQAADPANGTVSKATPKITWTGETIGSYLVLNPMANAPEDTPCEAPACDTFALTVADGPVDLELSNEVDDDAATGGIRVEQPDGTIVYADGDSGTGKPFKLKIKGAKNGAYSVGMINNFIDGPKAYKGGASALFPGAAPAPATPAPGATPAPSSGPAPAQSFTVTAKAPKKIKAKAKKLAVTVSVSTPVKSAVLTLAKGKKTVATAKSGAFSGTKKFSLKLKKLKKGSYTLSVQATSNEGVTVVKTLKVSAK